MRELEAWDTGRREFQSELEPVLSVAHELAAALQRAFSEGNWVGVPEVLSEARELGLLGKPDDLLSARPVQARPTKIVGTVLLG